MTSLKALSLSPNIAIFRGIGCLGSKYEFYRGIIQPIISPWLVDPPTNLEPNNSHLISRYSWLCWDEHLPRQGIMKSLSWEFGMRLRDGPSVWSLTPRSAKCRVSCMPYKSDRAGSQEIKMKPAGPAWQNSGENRFWYSQGLRGFCFYHLKENFGPHVLLELLLWIGGPNKRW